MDADHLNPTTGFCIREPFFVIGHTPGNGPPSRIIQLLPPGCCQTRGFLRMHLIRQFTPCAGKYEGFYPPFVKAFLKGNLGKFIFFHKFPGYDCLIRDI